MQTLSVLHALSFTHAQIGAPTAAHLLHTHPAHTGIPLSCTYSVFGIMSGCCVCVSTHVLSLVCVCVYTRTQSCVCVCTQVLSLVCVCVYTGTQSCVCVCVHRYSVFGNMSHTLFHILSLSEVIPLSCTYSGTCQRNARISTYICKHIHKCTCTYMYIYVHIHMYTCIHTHTHTHTHTYERDEKDEDVDGKGST